MSSDNECTGEHCLTCSDEVQSVRVLQVREAMAFVEVNGEIEEIDITLVEHAAPGDILLVHGGVAIACVNEGGDDEIY